MIPTGHEWEADGDVVRCALCGAAMGTPDGDDPCVASAAEPGSLECNGVTQ